MNTFILSFRLIVVNMSDSSLIMSIPMNVSMKNISRFESPVMIKTSSIHIVIISTIFSDISIFIYFSPIFR